MHLKNEYFVQSLSFDGVTGFHPNCPLSTIQAAAGCIELAEHQSLSVPYMFWYPLQSKKWAPTIVLPLLMWQKISLQSRNLEMLYWKLFNYSGTTFIQALMLISRIMRITSEGLNNLHSYTQTDGKVSAPFPMHKSSSRRQTLLDSLGSGLIPTCIYFSHTSETVKIHPTFDFHFLCVSSFFPADSECLKHPFLFMCFNSPPSTVKQFS